MDPCGRGSRGGLHARLEDMAQKTSPRTGANRTKKQRKQQAVYRRRRFIVAIALVVVLSLIVFCLYSLTQGLVAVNREIHHGDVYAISRKEVPSPIRQQKKSNVPTCDSSSVALSLTPSASSFGVGETMDFAISVKYVGSGKVGCLIDVSQVGTVLTVKSGGDVIWKSDVCPVDSDYRLIAKGDEVKRTVTWPGVRSGSECADAADLPKVDRGVYSAQLSVKGHAKTKSEPVGITVE